MKLSGMATAEGTARYCRRFEGKIPAEHFRQTQGLWLSSIGFGTYLGNHDDATDVEYHQAIVRAVESGCNVIDTAINYRLQRSERAIGTALKELATHGYNRDEIVIATKGGFIPYDGTPPKDARAYIEQFFIKPGFATAADIVSNCHCMTPEYLLQQLECSLRNLDLETIDIYYLHNPEFQLGKITGDEFDQRLVEAFAALQRGADTDKIQLYGTATWNGYRNARDAKDYLSLARVLDLAEKAAGRQHRFKAIQLPLNLAMSEALSSQNQSVGAEPRTPLEAAQGFGLTVMCSASVLQGQLTRDLPPIIEETFTGLETDGQRALQFVRSTPGVTTALVGMKQLRHVEENLRLARLAPASRERYARLFQANGPT